MGGWWYSFAWCFRGEGLGLFMDRPMYLEMYQGKQEGITLENILRHINNLLYNLPFLKEE